MSRAKLLAGCIAALTVGAVGAAQARPYIGLGAGIVRLDPDVVGNLSIEDAGRDTGFKAIVGKRVAPGIAVELFYTSLGTADFRPTGEVDYSNFGLNAVLALNTPKNGSKHPQYFLNVGVGGLDTDSEGITTERDNDVLVNAGLGVSFPMRHGFSLRANLEAFEREASMLSAVLIKEFGACHGASCTHSKDSKKHGQSFPDLNEGIPSIAATAEISNKNGETEALDTSPKKLASGEHLAEQIGELEQLENAYFNKDSAYVTSSGEHSLWLLMKTMNDYPEMQVEIQGHADTAEVGSARALSELRVLRVRGYLLKNGVDAERLSLVAYGDSQPASVDAGNHLNRRVQFRILSIE